MDRRKFLVGLGSASVGGSALLGSGAFSRVEAQRAVTIQVAEDPDAYLGMDKCRIEGSETPNSSYAHLDEHGHLEILMNDENPTIGGSPLGEGINSDSRMWVDNVFQLCNQGKEDVCVYIEDDPSWPEAPAEYDNERRVDFYLGGDREGSIVGERNQFVLRLGECVCIGLRTNSKGLSEGDELLENLDNEIRIIADVDGDCFRRPQECPWLTGEYECTTYEQDDEDLPYVRSGTRFRIFNEGDAGTDFDLAVANDPSSFRGDLFISSETDQSRIVDASFPKNALVAWDGCVEALPPEGDPEEFIRWGDYKSLRGVGDLDDWYDTYGTGAGSPGGAPSDFDDDRWVSELDMPEFDPDDDPLEDRIGPDEEIDPETFPDMSEAAEAEGWITCEKHDSD